METLLLVLFEGSRLLLRLLLVYLSIEMLRVVWRSRAPLPSLPLPPLPSPLPRVTVQLPVRDEGVLALRVIEAAVGLHWPREALTIQVLDDSTQPNTLEEVCAAWRSRGEPVELLRRGDPTGGKGGNLDFGLQHTSAEILVLFDADFVPPPHFLEVCVPHLLAEPRRAVVQVGWEFENRGTNLLTRVQALILSGLMGLEQMDRSRRGIPHHFNGSAGVWRRQAVVEGGGWRSPSSTEDLDLSMRVLAQGWQVLMLPDPKVPSRLPEDMAVWRRQFARWTEGKSGALMSTGAQILRGPLPASHKLALFSTLLSRVLCVCLTLTTFTLPLTSLDLLDPWLNYPLWTNAALMGGVTLACGLFYARALSLWGQSPLKALVLVPALMALMVGSSLLGTVAFLRGFWRRNPPSERTPKSRRHHLGLPSLAVVESAIGAAYLGMTVVLLMRDLPWQGLFFLCWGGAYTWVGVSSLWGRGQTQEEVLEYAEVLTPIAAQLKTQDP